MGSHSSLETRIISWARALSLIGLLGLLILAGITVLEALLRWVFKVQILGIADVSSLIIAVAIAACFPLVFAQQRNITVRFVGDALGRRWSSILDALGTLAALIIFCGFAWNLCRYTGKVAASHETTLVVGWTVAPWYWAATVLVALCIPIQVFLFVKQVTSALDGSDYAGRKDEG